MIKSNSSDKQAKSSIQSLFPKETLDKKSININYTQPDIQNPFFQYASTGSLSSNDSDTPLSTRSKDNLSDISTNVGYDPSFDGYNSDSTHSSNNQYKNTGASHEVLNNSGLVLKTYLLEEYDEGPSLSARNSRDEFLLQKTVLEKTVLEKTALEKIDNFAYPEAYKAIHQLAKLKSSKNESSIHNASLSSLNTYTTDSTQTGHIHLFKKILDLISASNELNIALKVQPREFLEQSEEKVETLRSSMSQKDIVHAREVSSIPQSKSLGNIESLYFNLSKNELSKIDSPTSNHANVLSTQEQETQAVVEILSNANEIAKSTIIDSENYDKSTIKNLIITISELTSQLKALKSDVTTTKEALESKFTGIEHAIAPAIKINEADMKYHYEMQSLHKDAALSDFHAGFTKTLEKYCVGAFARNSGLVNTGSDLGMLSLVAQMVPGAGIIAAPIEFLVTNAMEIEETNAISNAISNMPSMNIMINQIIPSLALKITLYPENIVNIRKATFSQFESFIKTAEGILWVDETPSAQQALGATQALSIMQGLESKKLDFNNESIDECVSQALIYFFSQSGSVYELEEVNNNMTIKPEIPYEIFASNSQKSSICKNQSQENNSLLGSCAASKLEDCHVVLGDKIQTPISCCSCLGEFGICKWAREHISFMWHSNNDHQDLI